MLTFTLVVALLILILVIAAKQDAHKKEVCALQAEHAKTTRSVQVKQEEVSRSLNEWETYATSLRVHFQAKEEALRSSLQAEHQAKEEAQRHALQAEYRVKEKALRAKNVELRSFAEGNALASQTLEGRIQAKEVEWNTFLGVVGLTPADVQTLMSEEVRVPAEYRRRVSKYVERVREVREAKKAWAAAQPVAYGAAPELLAESQQTSKERQAGYIETYRLECLEAAAKKKWVAPDWKSAQWGVVDRVVDGDTLIVTAPGGSYTVRLIGFDAPETVHAYKAVGHYGKEASDYMKHLVATLGSKCVIWLDDTALQAGWSPYDKYGRLCAHVAIKDQLLGELMLSTGHADVLDAFPYDAAILGRYRLARDTAKSDDVGMWAHLNAIEKSRIRPTPSTAKKFAAVQEIGVLIKAEQDTRALLTGTLHDLVTALTVRSKRSAVLHDVNCHFVSRIKDSNRVQGAGDVQEQVPCKHCGGDPLLRD